MRCVRCGTRCTGTKPCQCCLVKRDMGREATIGRNPFVAFAALARALGYTEKVVGDDAYQRRRRPGSPTIRLLGARGGRLQLFETGRGRREVPYVRED